MRQGSIRRITLLSIIIFFLLSLTYFPASAQNEKQILDDISEDWPTDMVLIYVETPNKFDPTYGTNITDRAVLDEMSAFEDLMDPNKEDNGEQDDITFVLSISTLIKEINTAPENIWDATIDELDPLIDPGPFPGDSEYAIPDNQEDIDHIVEGIPPQIIDLFVKDTNSDRVWDSAIIWIGTTSNSKYILNKIDSLIDKYYVDPQASESHDNSQESWKDRIDSGEIHCQMSNLDYVNSYEAHVGQEFMMETGFALIVLFILLGLTAITLLKLRSGKKKGDEKGGSKKNFNFALTVFVILIVTNVLLGLYDTPDPNSDKFNNFSNVFNGGQMGLILVRGNPGPSDDAPSFGTGSMKDIEVLDAMERIEHDLENIRYPENPSDNLNSPLTIVDILKTYRVPEYLRTQIPVEYIPAQFNSQYYNIFNSSFWDAIHIAGEIDSVIWYARYGKSLQDTLINIFYKSLTPEMRSIFVNEDYSRSLFYIQLPMQEGDHSEYLKDRINSVVSNHQQFISTTDVALISSDDVSIESLTLVYKVLGIYIILIVGILMAVLLNFKVLDLDKRKKGNGKVSEIEGEAIFEDITHEEDNYSQDYPYDRPPPNYKP